MKTAKLGAIAVVVAALLWSVDGLLRIHLQTSLRAPVIVFYEHLFGFILLAPLVLQSMKGFKDLTRKQWLSITIVALLSGAIGTILYTAALGRTMFIPFSVVVLLQQLNPIFAISASSILLKEPLTKRFFGFSLVALVAAYFLWLPNGHVNLSTGNGTLMAGLLAIGAAAAWGTSTAFSKYTLKGTSTVHITALRFGITPVFALFFVVGSGDHKLPALTGDQLKYLLFITFSTGLVALLIYYYGLKRVLASRSAILELAWPASAVLVGWLWQHQGLTWSQAIAALAMTGAIYYIAKEDRDTEKDMLKSSHELKSNQTKTKLKTQSSKA